MSMAHTPLTPPEGQHSPERKRGWLSRIAPGVRNLVAKRPETPENLWVKCPATGEMLYRSDLEASLWVTPAGHHMRIGPDLRFAFTFDEGVYEEIESPTSPDDPLHFTDQKPYKDRLAAARLTGTPVGCVAAGLGISLLPRALIGPVWQAGRVSLHTLPPEESQVATVFIHRREAYLSSALRAFLAHVSAAPS